MDDRERKPWDGLTQPTKEPMRGQKEASGRPPPDNPLEALVDGTMNTVAGTIRSVETSLADVLNPGEKRRRELEMILQQKEQQQDISRER